MAAAGEDEAVRVDAVQAEVSHRGGASGRAEDVASVNAQGTGKPLAAPEEEHCPRLCERDTNSARGEAFIARGEGGSGEGGGC